MRTTLYVIGLILAMLYLVIGFDDFIWDIISLGQAWTIQEKAIGLQRTTYKTTKVN